MIKQTKITVSGAQISKKQVLASARTKFAFASTLAVYIYDSKTYQLLNLLSFTDANISAIAWEQQEERYLAQATVDKRLVIWDLQPETIAYKVDLASHVTQIEWSRLNPDTMFLVLNNGELKAFTLSTKKVSSITIDVEKARPNVVRAHPNRPDILAIGLDNGRIVFLNQASMKTLDFDAADQQQRFLVRMREKQILVGRKDLNDDEIEEIENELDQEACITDMMWDLYEDNIITAHADGNLNLVAFHGLNKETQIMQRFERSNQPINRILWADDKSGNFLTSTEKIGTLTLWNVASVEPRRQFKVGNCGIHNMHYQGKKPGGQRVSVVLKSGSVLIFNLSRRSIEFQTEASHSETIFDVAFAPKTKDVIASSSYDGTIRVWDSSTMKVLTVCDTSRNSPIAKEPKRIIYSISWHPDETKIAAVTINGNCLVYDALKSKLLSHITPMQGFASFKVAWNQKQKSSILMSTSNNHVFLLVIDDLCKNIGVQMNYPHNDAVYGVSWSSSIPTQFVSGCKDGKMRLFDTMTGTSNAIKVFSGHTERIYNVLYNPIIPNIVVSGSDDTSIRVWDVTSDSYEAIQVLGGAGVANSHINNVRGLLFLPELPYCLMSGSWDSTIKLWDIRTGQCMYTVTDHNADVYQISVHPERPFVFTSCSRDTTIRLFQMDGMISSLKIQLLSGTQLDNSKNQLYDTPVNTYQSKGTYKFSSKIANELIQQTSQGFKSDFEKLLQMYDFMNFSEGQNELFAIMKTLQGSGPDKPDNAELLRLSNLKVVHSSQLSDVLLAKAIKYRTATGMQFINTPWAKKEDRLLEAAKICLKSGHIKEFCEIQFQLKNYKKAMAFAPGVSIEYWQELSERTTEAMEKEGNQDAPLSAIISNKCGIAISMFHARKEYEDGKVVKALQLTGVFKSVLDKIRSKPQEAQERKDITDIAKEDPQLIQFVEAEADKFFYQGQTFLAAATLLSFNLFEETIRVLVRTNEIYLAYYLSKYFHPSTLKEVAQLIAEKAERYFQTDICMRILKEEVQDPTLEALVRNRLLRKGVIKRQPNQKELDASLAQQGAQLCQQDQLAEGLLQLILGNSLDEACQRASQSRVFMDFIQNPSAPVMAELLTVLELLQQTSLSRVPTQSKSKILILSALTGVFKALWYGFFEILLVMAEHLNELTEVDSSLGNFNEFTSELIDQLHEEALKHSNKSSGENSDVANIPLTSTNFVFSDPRNQELYTAMMEGLTSHMQNNIKSVLFGKPGIYLHIVNAGALQGKALSTFSKQMIKGQVFKLEEEGKTCVMSQEEAIEWTICNRFSRLGNGFRMNPF